MQHGFTSHQLYITSVRESARLHSMAGSDSHSTAARIVRLDDAACLVYVVSMQRSHVMHAAIFLRWLKFLTAGWSVHAGDTQCSMISPITLSTRGVLLLSVAIVLAAAVMVTAAQPEAPLFANAKETKVTGGNLLVFSSDPAELKVRCWQIQPGQRFWYLLARQASKCLLHENGRMKCCLNSDPDALIRLHYLACMQCTERARPHT